MATPLIAGGAVAMPAPTAAAFAPPVANANPLAVAAFILACAMMVFLLSGIMIGASHSLELEQLQKELQTKSSDPGSQVQAMMEYVRTSGGFPWWLVAITMFQMSAMTACAAAIVCGLLALRRSGRRTLAVVALISCGCVALFFCLSFVAAFAGMGLRR